MNFNWEPMGSFENRRCVFVTVCDNPSKCVLKTLQFAYVETGHTPEEIVAVIKGTTHQGINHQDRNFISQVLFYQPEIMHLNEACLTNIVYMISKVEISIKRDTKVLYNNCWMHEITKYPNWEIAI